MKKILIVLVCLAMLVGMAACQPAAPAASEAPAAPAATEAPAEPDAPSTEPDAPAAEAKVIGYYKDAADDFYKAGYEVFKTLAEAKGWQVIDVVGGGTAPEQIAAIENFITMQVDAIVCVQNSPQTTSECLAKCNDAGIPYFALTHNPPNDPGLAGFAGFDWVQIGRYAGESAMKNNVKKLIMIEGKLGQGTASGQSEGFIKSYADAGKDVGNALNEVGVKGTGGADLEVVFWGSGNWFAGPAKTVMQDAIAALGKDGFDGVYVHNDEMLTGVLEAMKEAGLNSGDYWIGSSNGKEKSWDWVANGEVTMDVNECPTLEADIAFQQVTACFEGKEYKKAIFVSILPYDKETLNKDQMVPWILEDYMAKRAANAFVYDMNDPAHRENPDYK